MNIIIIGMGRLGAGLAQDLLKKGRQVTAIDSDPESFEALGTSFSGTRIVGDGMDRRTLEQAKIGETDALIACTGNDEANIVIARIAKNIFLVPHVVARLYDMEKTDTYRRIGIQTISTTAWGIERASELLTYHHLDSICDLGDGSVQVVCIDVPPLLAGHMVRELTAIGEIHVIGIRRGGRTFIPTTGTILEPGDVLYAAMLVSASGRLRTMLGL